MSKPAPDGFGVALGPAFVTAFKTYLNNALTLSAAAVVTMAAYACFRLPAQALFNDDRVLASIAVDLVGLVVSGTLALPWYTSSLAAARGNPISLRASWSPRLLGYQATASFWFWAGVLLGLRYLLGLPSILVGVLYAFHGFVIADDASEHSRGGLRALGTSVRLSEGRRFGLFAVGALLTMFNLLGALPLGFEQGVTPLTIGASVIGLTITACVTMVYGAIIYDAFKANLT